MLLAELTVNGTVKRISNEQINTLTHQWDRKIVSASNIKFAMSDETGGYIRPVFGSITLSQDLFIADWEPPRECTLVLKLTTTTEESAATVFSGNAVRSEMSKDGVVYDIYSTEYDDTLDGVKVFQGTLNAVFTELCGASYLNVDINTDYARATSPDVYIKAEHGEKFTDILSKVSAAHCHIFYIKSGTLYLVDMLLDNGEDINLSQHDLMIKEYKDYTLFSSLETKGKIVTYTQSGSNSLGGGKVLDIAPYIETATVEMGDDMEGDEKRLWYNVEHEFQANAIYRMTVRYKLDASSGGSINVGFQTFDSDGLMLTAHSFAVSSSSVTSGFVEKIGYAQGTSGVGEGGEHDDINDPCPLNDDTHTMKVRLAMADFCDATIDYITLEIVDSSDNFIEELMHEDFLTFYSYGYQNIEQWFKYVWTPPYWWNTTSSSASDVTDQLSNAKTILERRWVKAKIPFKPSTTPNPGQKVTWTDEEVVPDGVSAASVWMRARNITYNLDENLVLIEGEGAIS